MGTWNNDDGLRVLFGTTEATATPKSGYLNTGGNEYNELLIEFSSSDLDSTNVTVIGGATPLPDNARIVSATLYVDTAFDSTADGASLDLGLATLASFGTGTLVETDYDGIDDGILEADLDADGDTIECDGVLINTDLTAANVVTAQAVGEAFTAGKGRLLIQYYKTT